MSRYQSERDLFSFDLAMREAGPRCEARIDYPTGSTVGTQCEKAAGHALAHSAKVDVSLTWSAERGAER